MADAREEVGKLWLAKEAAEEAYNAHPEGVRIVWNEDGDAQILGRCGKSGVVLLQSDEVLECAVTGQLFLRSALGLPPCPAREEDAEEDREAA